MIRHINGQTFQPYGSVLAEGEGISRRPNHHSVYVPESTASDYRTVGPLGLGPESGMTVLSVSEDGENFREFYLDKTVRLKTGIWFRLTAFGGKASVQMSGASMPLSLGQRINERDFAVRPKMRVECLYTLFYQEKEPGFVFSGESHPMAELLYVDRGQVHSVADGQELLLSQGDMVLYTPEQWHMQYADADQAPRMVTIGFWARGFQWEAFRNRRFRLDRDGLSILQGILAEQERDNPDKIFCLLTLLLLHLQAEFGQENRAELPAEISGENTIIRKAQQYVQAHVEEKLTVTTVAQAIGVSPSYLTALFHKHLEFSPGEYIRRVRLQMSKQLIREGKLNFTQIAENLQYSTVHHFSRQFKQVFGMTPTEYAKSVR